MMPAILADGLSRRGLAVICLAWATGGCGFRPVYGGASAAASPSVAHRLAAISVDLIPERAGQLLQQALQVRLAGAEEQLRRYALHADFAISGDAIAVQPDSSVTRIRLVGISNYTLVRLADRGTMTSGTARALDGVDVADQQYFAEDLEQDAVVRRLAQAVADQVTLQLAVYFRAHAAA